MKTYIEWTVSILIILFAGLALSITFNPDSLYLVGLIHPEEAARIVVEEM